ncbi:MAG: hypothetical protein R3B93_05975 [Bacteroidia bacterium]
MNQLPDSSGYQLENGWESSNSSPNTPDYGGVISLLIADPRT